MVEVETSATGTSGTYTGMETMQICLAYNYGDGGATSAENTMRAVSRTLYSMPIKYYYALDISGIGPMTDAIDGVPVTALETIPNTSIEEGDGVILTGNNAVSYVRYRDTSDLESSIARQERQKQFIRAFIKQAMSRAQGNVGDLVTLYNTAQEYSTTNLGVSEFSYLASEMISNGVNDVSVYSLDGTMTLGASGYAEYNLDKDSVYQTVLDVYYTQVS